MVTKEELSRLSPEQEALLYAARLHEHLQAAVVKGDMETYRMLYPTYTEALEDWYKIREETSCLDLMKLARSRRK